jgi:hypothetical protein
MFPLRTACLAALFCVIPAFSGCIDMPVPVDRQVQVQTLEFHTRCLSSASPAYSKAHSDCVLAHYEERQQELERLRDRVMPPPPPLPPSAGSPVTPEPGPGSNFLI